MATVKPTYTGSDLLVTSELLGENFVEFNKLREKKVHKQLWTEAYYELASVQDGSEGKLIVADGTVSSPDTEIQLSDVAPVKSGYTPNIGEYVNFIDEKEIYMKQSDIQKESDLLDFDTLLP